MSGLRKRRGMAQFDRSHSGLRDLVWQLRTVGLRAHLIDTTVFPRIALAAAQLRFKIEHRRIEWGGGERVQFTFRTAAAAVTLKS